MLLLKVKKKSLYSGIPFGYRILNKMFGVCLFKQEHIVILIW
jgi:hypothetical protein